MDKQAARKAVSILLAENSLTMRELCECIDETSPQDHISVNNLSNKLAKGSLRYCDMVVIANVLGYDIRFVPRNIDEKLNLNSKVDLLVKIKEQQKNLDEMNEIVKSMFS